MRCLACNCELNDDEATRRDLITKQFLDLCDNCFYDNPDDEVAIAVASTDDSEDNL